MLQNKYTFNQSSVELEIIGLPDLSKNDNDKTISIISNWKLSIINQPEIEGGIDHLKSILKAFYSYTSLLLLDREEKLESKLIDISQDENGIHNLVLKSTKPKVKPLRLKLGNAELSDIINCFDQLKDSEDINLDFQGILPIYKKNRFKSFNKHKLINIFLPPLISVLSISFISFIFINIYESDRVRNQDITFIYRSKLAKSDDL